MKPEASILSKTGIASTLLVSTLIAGCGSSGSSDSGSPVEPPTTLSGVAAAGAPIIGSVVVKGALGMTKSAVIEADGSYDVDVTGLTAPYRLRAQGSVGGRQYKLHSYAVESDVGGTVNITPFTDLIIANVAGQIAESFFDQTQQVNPLDEADIEAQETELQAKLQDVLSAVGVSTAIDLLRTSFSANHSGLDAALDIVRVEVDTATNIATLTNVIDNTTITDDVTSTGETETLTVSDPANLQTAATDTQQISALFDTFTTAFANGLPTGSNLTTVSNLYADDFLHDGFPKSAHLTELTTDPGMIGSIFGGVVVSNLDSEAGTAEVAFSWGSNGLLEPEASTWFVAKDTTAGWQFRGNQRIVESYFGFHCNDGDGFVDNTPTPWACGINTQFWDELTTDNPNGTVIASGTVRILDGDTQAEKAVIYLGTPAGGTAGDVQVYNELHGSFDGDYRGLENAAGGTDPSIFVAGDIIEYNLYTADLDTSVQNTPAVIGSPVATYTDTLAFVPDPTAWSDSSNKLPVATAATQTAIQNYTIGDALTIGWTLAAGTRIEEVLVRITDSAGDEVEIWDWIYGSTSTEVSFTANQLDTSALLQTDTQYELRVRIYASDEISGQTHSRDYIVNIDAPAATPVGTGGNCDVTGITTLAAFEAEMDACSTVIPISANDLIGNSFTFVGATNEVTTYTDASNGTFTNDGGTTVIPLTWSIDHRGYLTVNYTVPNVGSFYDVYVVYGQDGAGGQLAHAFTNEDNSTFSETIIPASTTSVSLSCDYVGAYDEVNDEPIDFNSFTDFEAVITDCGNEMVMDAAAVTGTWAKSVVETDSSTTTTTVVYNANNTGSYTESNSASTGVYTCGFDWSISNGRVIATGAVGTACDNYTDIIVFLSDSTQRIYAEDGGWGSDQIADSVADGYIFSDSLVKQ